jgi:hypothetical protein
MKYRTEKEIDGVLNAVEKKIDEGGSRWRGMTYEQGVDAALRWVRGDTNEHPYGDDGE